MSRQLVGLWILLALAGPGGFLSAIQASDPTAALEQAIGLVNQALQAEMDGDVLGRERLLTEAQFAESQFAPARWFRGQISDGKGEWLTVDQAIEKAKSVRLLEDYVAFRATLPPTIDGNWQAAIWCAKNGLPEQCRAHLMNIILVDADHIGARKALGHQLVGNDWLSTEDQLRLHERAEFAKVGFAKYQTQVDELLQRAYHFSSKINEPAIEQLKAINDPLAIPVMEAAAEKHGTQTALFVVGWLGTIDHPEAAQSLMRLALLSLTGD